MMPISSTLKRILHVHENHLLPSGASAKELAVKFHPRSHISHKPATKSPQGTCPSLEPSPRCFFEHIANRAFLVVFLSSRVN